MITKEWLEDYKLKAESVIELQIDSIGMIHLAKIILLLVKEIEANRAETQVKPLLADEKLKEIFIEIVLSNYRLGCAEYNRNPAYNDTHYHYKAEEKMMYYLQDNYPELWKEIGKRILEIDSQLPG